MDIPLSDLLLQIQATTDALEHAKAAHTADNFRFIMGLSSALSFFGALGVWFRSLMKGETWRYSSSLAGATFSFGIMGAIVGYASWEDLKHTIFVAVPFALCLPIGYDELVKRSNSLFGKKISKL